MTNLECLPGNLQRKDRFTTTVDLVCPKGQEDLLDHLHALNSCCLPAISISILPFFLSNGTLNV